MYNVHCTYAKEMAKHLLQVTAVIDSGGGIYHESASDFVLILHGAWSPRENTTVKKISG